MNQYSLGGKILRAAVVASMCLSSFLASTTFVAAQDASTGKVVGTIKDQNGSAVSGAEVSLRHQQQAVVASTTSDANGGFTLDGIPRVITK